MESSKTVLVVEDDPSVRKLVRAILAREGIDLLEAGCAEDGIELARERTPDLILMDVRLPGIDGLEATQALRRDDRTKDIPVVAVSAYAMEQDQKDAREAGCRGTITKPFGIDSFVASVRGYLSSAVGSGPRARDRVAGRYSAS